MYLPFDATDSESAVLLPNNIKNLVNTIASFGLLWSASNCVVVSFATNSSNLPYDDILPYSVAGKSLILVWSHHELDITVDRLEVSYSFPVPSCSWKWPTQKSSDFYSMLGTWAHENFVAAPY